MKSFSFYLKFLLFSFIFSISFSFISELKADNQEKETENHFITTNSISENSIQSEYTDQKEPDFQPQEQALNNLMAQAAQAEQLEQVSQEIVKQLDMLAEITSDVAQILNNNQVRLTPVEKSAARSELTNLGTMIGKIRYSAFLLAQKENFPNLVTLIGQIQQNLTTAIKSGLKEFPHTEFDLTARAQPTDELDLTQLEDTLAESTDHITALSKKAPHVGLSSFNILYRKLRKLNHDYKILRRVGTAALIGVGVGWIMYKVIKPEDFFPKKEEKPVDFSNIKFTENEQKIINVQANNASLYEKYAADVIMDNKLKEIGGDPRSQAIKSKIYSSEEWKKVWWIKKFIGCPIPTDVLGGWDNMDPKTKGLYSHIENRLGATGLSLISFACPGLALFEYLAPVLKDWTKYYSNLFSGNINQVDDYLAGGPIKKVGLISDYEKEVSVTLDDVIGNDHAKQEMLRIVAYVTNNEFFDRPGIVPPTGILLEGPTRTGKSFLAEATAGTIKQIDKQMGKKDTLHYVEIKAAELVEVGITQFFEEAQNYAPIIIFIDELDTIGLHRLRDSKRFGEMLTAMSTLNRKNKNKVIIIAATNKPEQLDDSLRASGRFGKHLHFVYPTMQERKLFLQKELEKRAIFIEEEVVDKLARESEGYPFDALSEMLRTALMDGKIQGKLPQADDFERAFDEDINLILSDKSPLPLAEQELVSIHQSGHAIARILLDASLQLTKVTTRPTGVKIAEEDLLFTGWKDKDEKDEEQKKARRTVVYGNTFTMHKPHTLKFDSHEDLLDELTICLAGHAAERLLYGNTSYSYHTEDNEEAMTIAKRIVFEGMREKDVPKELKERKLVEAHTLIAKHKEIAYNLLAKHKEELAFVALVLLKEELLTAEQIMHIMNFVISEKSKESSGDTSPEPFQQPVTVPGTAIAAA